VSQLYYTSHFYPSEVSIVLKKNSLVKRMQCYMVKKVCGTEYRIFYQSDVLLHPEHIIVALQNLHIKERLEVLFCIL